MGYVPILTLLSLRSLLLVIFRAIRVNYVSSYSKEKVHINVVVIGHVDSGKSTTTGKNATTLSLARR